MGWNFGNTRDFSEEIAADIDKEVKKIVDEQYEQAKKLLSDNRDMLEYIAKNLLEKETLDEKEFDDLMRDVRVQRGEIIQEEPERENNNTNEGEQNG